MMENVIIFGTTDLAEVLVYHLQHDERYKIVAVTVEMKYCNEKHFADYPLIPFETINDYIEDDYGFFICVGYSQMNEGRKKIYHKIKNNNYRVLTYIHPTAVVQTNRISEGSLFFENVTIGPYCTIGTCNIFYPCAHLAHHSKVGNYNFFAISSSVAGHVIVENQCFFGNNSTTKNGIIIRNKTLLGAGAYLDKDTEEGAVIVPERSIRLENKTSNDFAL